MAKYDLLGVSKLNNMTHFGVAAAQAQEVELCLFTADENSEQRLPLKRNENGIWHIEVADIKSGQKYGYRVSGEYNPEQCLFFNSHKLLIDPFAKEISKSMSNISNADKEFLLSSNHYDSAAIMAKSIVTFDDAAKDAQQYPFLHQKPQIPWQKTLIYETHIRGFSINHPDLPAEIRGKFAAFSHPQIIQYLKALNYNHIELMPITPTIGDFHLDKEKGLSEYWGYNPINHFAVDPRFGTREEFKQMINNLHQAGIEVGLDLVYNHTGEFGADRFSLSYKGFDAQSFYRFEDWNPSAFVNTTGCRNGFNPNTDLGRKIVRDSLFYFASHCGVDAVREDLAGDCALDNHLRFDANGAFQQVNREVVEQTGLKISGEPWSAMGGYFLGQMRNIKEWNDEHKKTLRRFMRGESNVIGALAHHISGSGVDNAIHFTNAHDGMTRKDLVFYSSKNNYANNENNNDGCNQNYCCPTANASERLTKMKSLHALNILSCGIPMSLGGDEICRTQKGNNNAYCQDNELSWYNWRHFNNEQQEMYIFVRKINALRVEHEIFQNTTGYDGQPRPNGYKDVSWLRNDGQEMQPEDWNCGYARTLVYQLNGQDKTGKQIDDDFLILNSAHSEGAIDFKFPASSQNYQWQLVFDTAKSSRHKEDICYKFGDCYSVQPYSVVVLTHKTKPCSLKQNQLQQIIANKLSR